jgi:hypothetical protein
MANITPHITFNGGSINEGTGVNALQIDNAFGLNLNMVSIDTTKISIPHTSYCEGLTCNVGATVSDIGGALPYPFNSSYVQRTGGSNSLTIIPRGGIIGTRGRALSLTFSLSTIGASATATAKFVNELSSWVNGFPMLNQGSLLSMQICHKLTATSRGTLTLTPSYNLISNMSSASETLAGFPTLILNAETENQKLANYLPLAYVIDSTYIFGFKVTASSDYVEGTYGQILITCILET